MAAPDEEAVPAISITVRDVTGETTVHENVRPAETDVETLRAAVAAARGTEPTLLRTRSWISWPRRPRRARPGRPRPSATR